MKKIEFLYFDGCPSYQQAFKNLKDALLEAQIEADIEMINIDTPEKGETLGFLGSPSIRIDGADLESRTGEASYSCRIYIINGNSTGLPTKEYILETLRNPVKQVESFKNGNSSFCS